MRTTFVVLALTAWPVLAQETFPRAVPAGGIVVRPEFRRDLAQIAGRSSLPLAARVTTSEGAPVEGARVSFRWLAGETSGRFASGLTTEIAVTGPNGMAEAGRIRWEARPGMARLQIIAAKEGQRTEVVLPIEVLPVEAQASPARRRAIWAFAGSAALTFLAGLAWAAR